MAAPVHEMPAVADAAAEKPAAAAAAAKAEPTAPAATGGLASAMEHMKAAAAALVPGDASGDTKAAEPGMADKLKEAKTIAEATAGEVKGAMGKISGLFGK
jgi:hypothetical protein